VASTLARFESSGFLLMGTLKTLMYAAPVDNEEALRHRIVDVCHTIRNYPSIFEWMHQSTMKCVKGCTESHGGHSQHLF
jgi:hypothetical protein